MRRFLRVAAALLAVALFAAAGLWIRAWGGFGLVRVSGTSMNDTLKSGDIVLVTRLDYRERAPELGDVVVCRFPGRGDTYIKRVCGLPGQRAVLEKGSLTLDGFPVSEPYVSSMAEDYEVALGEDQYLLLGDNRAESYDSRMTEIGPIGRDAFVGKVRCIVWPLSRAGRVE